MKKVLKVGIFSMSAFLVLIFAGAFVAMLRAPMLLDEDDRLEEPIQQYFDYLENVK